MLGSLTTTLLWVALVLAVAFSTPIPAAVAAGLALLWQASIMWAGAGEEDQ